ncbi:MAG: aspartate aminotransferase family protein [Hyphomicrobiaceae bacterium]
MRTHPSPLSSHPASEDWSLDPRDEAGNSSEGWETFRADAHRALDDMIDHIGSIRSRPVWQPAPPAVQEAFRRPTPVQGEALSGVLDEFQRLIVPYANGNGHPLFMGWVHGAGTPVGMVADMLAAGLNSNCGGRNHIAHEVEAQITRWMADAIGYPRDASGLFVTGTSMANFLAVLIARDNALGHSVRKSGLAGAGTKLAAYASSEAHGCVRRAMELAGIGSDHLAAIPVGPDGTIRLDLLETRIAEDRRAGLTPFLVVGTAGSVNTGAIDDLDRLADIAEAHRLWFHVDGAFGALCVLAPELKPLVKGLERAKSIAFDFHKWLQVPYDAGFLICREPAQHVGTFADNAAYLQRAERGLAAGEIWPTDLGPDLSRGFRALKTWFTFKVYGIERLGEAIEGTCRVAQHLKSLVERSDRFELRAPVKLNIVCFSAKGADAGEVNTALVMDLHESGLAAPSITTLGGKPVIRCAIVNHRTRLSDMDRFIEVAEAAVGRLAGQA